MKYIYINCVGRFQQSENWLINIALVSKLFNTLDNFYPVNFQGQKIQLGNKMRLSYFCFQFLGSLVHGKLLLNNMNHFKKQLFIQCG